MIKKFSKVKSHQRYKLKSGEVVKGVTSIIRNLGWNTEVLIAWARREALAGRDPHKVRDEAADQGTILHFIIECYFESQIKGEEVEPDLSEFSPTNVEKAKPKVDAFIEWAEKHNVKAEHIECQRVSELWKYGGTSDFDGYVDGELAILDYKSGGKDVYIESKIQGAALGQLYFEEYGILPAVYIIKLGDDGEIHPVKVGNLAKLWDCFYHALMLDRLKFELQGG